MHLAPRTVCLCASVCMYCTEAMAHHFPPSLEGALLTRPVAGYAVEVLLLPAVAEVGRTTGILISIRQAGTERYYTGPVTVELGPAAESDSAATVELETVPRRDLKGDREVRHIFREPGSYVVTIRFSPEDAALAVVIPVEVTVNTGPSILLLGAILAVFVGAIFAVALLKRKRSDA